MFLQGGGEGVKGGSVEEGGVDQEGLHGIAGSWVTALGVQHCTREGQKEGRERGEMARRTDKVKDTH